MSEQRIAEYLVLERLGEGGMGVVFLAEDETLRRRVALKSLRAQHRLDRDLRARFLREARVLSQLDHPGICRVFNYVHGPEADYIVLELIEGRDLRRAIAEGLERGHALDIAIQLADALGAAHAAGVVHRDLKPANVMLTREGRAKVLDFGLSRTRDPEPVPVPEPDPLRSSAPAADLVTDSAHVGEQGTLVWSIAPPQAATEAAPEPEESLRTQPGGVMGTLRYMSPEQARGEFVTAASDMFALGLVLQELFTGRPGYEEGLTFREALARSCRGATRPVQGLDRDLAQLVERLKSNAAHLRPTAAETLQRLRWIQGKPQRLWRRALAAGLVLAALGGAAKYTFDLGRERTRAQARTEGALGMMETIFEQQIPVLEEVGRLDAFDAAAEGVSAYFARIAGEELTDRERLQMARLRMRVGDVRDRQGRPAEALLEYEAAGAIAADLAQRFPEDPDMLLALGAAQFYLGRSALAGAGGGELALERFRAYQDLAERSARVDGDRVRAVRERIMARNAVAGALLGLGRAGEALAEQADLVELLREQCAERHGDPVARLDLADNLSWLASAQSASGEPDAARESLEEELALRRELLAADPRNALSRRSLSFCLTFLAQAWLDGDRLDAALESALEARDLLVPLAEQDPENAELRRNLAVAETVLDQVETRAGGR